MSGLANIQTPTDGPAANSLDGTSLFGRFMLPDMSEHPCQVSAISIDGATFITSHVPLPGLAVVAYLEEVGRIEATSAEHVPGGFSAVRDLVLYPGPRPAAAMSFGKASRPESMPR